MNSLTLAERVAVTDKLDYLILKFLIQKREKYQVIPKSIIKNSLNLTENEYAVSSLRLLKTGAVTKTRIRGEEALSITFTGLDIVATKSLYTKKILNRLGIVIGEGKESKVHFGYSFSDDTVAVKYHRIGRRTYKRKIDEFYNGNWISMTLENAKREYENLECVKRNMGNVPSPLGFSVNAVVMEYFEGIPLYRTEVQDPENVLDKILATLRISQVYCDGLTHGDLSPYNVLVDESQNVMIIDWPQATRDNEALEADVENILSYFDRKYSISRDFEEVIDYVKGKT
ncbi:serine/threonine protein kinase [Metallosphaera tengchongensis]|uniref:non-specific serine/threonine protein kinase n=1 Tax=Metallosphaera tengchongensis TaxID=1532350 RepID=A0A6N0NWI0_9CREN|nr:RIO1 family regulatory kinase/ATPase [Metallosphaera tengchongensis]QKQ99988.1 serine/threonine protein kinase [Metallosphaera tengchongensis]